MKIDITTRARTTVHGSSRAVVLLVTRGAVAPGRAAAGPLSVPPPGKAATEQIPMLKDVGIDQKLERQIPLDLAFVRRDRPGRDARQYFGDAAGRARARVLRVPDALHAGAERPRRLARGLTFTAGKEFEVLVVSFDPGETPAMAAAQAASSSAALRPRRDAGAASTS